jgi:PPOX class probable F420-dependent enzyme
MSIADAPCAWLTTLRRDGSPHTTPVWFLLVNQTFWIASSTLNVKVRNAARDPRVSLAVDGTGAQPHVAQGRVTVHARIEDFPDVVALLAEKYDGWDATDESHDGPRVLLEVPVDRWLLAAG